MLKCWRKTRFDNLKDILKVHVIIDFEVFELLQVFDLHFNRSLQRYVWFSINDKFDIAKKCISCF